MDNKTLTCRLLALVLCLFSINVYATLIEDFESGLTSGVDSNGIGMGFFTFSGLSPVSASVTDAPPVPVPTQPPGNHVLSISADVVNFAGVGQTFTNASADEWISQDWSAFNGISFWLLGQNTGTELFLDIFDNRNPGSTTDDAERFTISFVDDFAGWQQLQFPFSDFIRNDLGNGAPNDGFGLTSVHGWAFGSLMTNGLVTWHLDNLALYPSAVNPSPVPAPATLTLLVTGVLCLTLLRKHQR